LVGLLGRWSVGLLVGPHITLSAKKVAKVKGVAKVKKVAKICHQSLSPKFVAKICRQSKKS
jgi:hypothetical protein